MALALQHAQARAVPPQRPASFVHPSHMFHHPAKMKHHSTILKKQFMAAAQVAASLSMLRIEFILFIALGHLEPDSSLLLVGGHDREFANGAFRKWGSDVIE